tara:strand:+ start:759 stop:995 length:237 start_codon:yes stop_codon:yes gene_type:complete
MIINNKFKVGDLVLFPQDNSDWDSNEEDYGIVTQIDSIGGEGADSRNYYHIYWAIEKASTIEEDNWADYNLELVVAGS